MNLFLDTETTGKPICYYASIDKTQNWPRLVQLAWIQAGEQLLPDSTRRVATIQPVGFAISAESTAIHGISDEEALRTGEPLAEVLAEFCRALLAADRIVGHNLNFDVPVVACELFRMGLRSYADVLVAKPRYDTMRSGTDLCQLPGPRGFKWPKLEELYLFLFHRRPDNQHRADGDALATAECYYEMVRRGIPAAKQG
jgi:DNA polymerase III subunit epsilon